MGKKAPNFRPWRWLKRKRAEAAESAELWRAERAKLARAKGRGPELAERFFLWLFFFVVLTLLAVVAFLAFTGRLPSISDVVPPLKCDAASAGCEIYGWDDFRSLMFGIAGLVGSIFGLFQLSNSARRTRLSDNDVSIKREAERNDRYVKAVELLAHNDDTVRMGGIYALERLALEDEGAYFDTVVEVLSAYVRYQTNAVDDDGQPTYPPRRIAQSKEPVNEQTFSMMYPDQHGPWDRDAYFESFWEWCSSISHTEPIKTALRVLHRLTDAEPERISRHPVDLRGAWLVAISLPEWNLSYWRLDGARLDRACLIATALDSTRFDDTILVGAELTFARFDNINLSRAQLDTAAWPTKNPPKGTFVNMLELPRDFETLGLDKTWCTDVEHPYSLRQWPTWTTPPEV